MNAPYSQHWQSETFYDDNELYFEEMLLAIALAKKSIELETYIFNYDDLGKRFIDALARAKQRGVNVRVIIDGVGSVYYSETVIEAFKRKGIECRIFRPLPWQLSLFDNSIKKEGFLSKPLLYLKHINHRDHRKLCLIDNEELWSGSLNITQSHYKKEHGGDGRIDFGIRVAGEDVLQIAHQFDHFWDDNCEDITGQKIRTYLSNHTVKLRLKKNQHLIKIINRAKYRVWLCSAYFSPSLDIMDALIKASKRGVDIKIIVPVVSDFKFFPILTSYYYKALLETGIEVYEFPHSFLHAKGLLIDKKAIIGSTNINYRSLFHDLELDIVVRQNKTVSTIESSFSNLLNRSNKITNPNKHIKYRWFRKILYLLRYWL